MKAIVYHNYGPPEVLQCADIERPVAGDNEVLLKVCAAGVNPPDWHLMKGTPRIIRLLIGLRKPKEIRLGRDVAGQVEAVGRNVTKFKPGDEVFGAAVKRHSLSIRVLPSRMAIKPEKATLSKRLLYLWRHSPPCRAFATRDRSGQATKS